MKEILIKYPPVCRLFVGCLLVFLAAGLTPLYAAQSAPAVPEITASAISDEEVPDWVARWELARCLTILKRYDEAIADYRLLLQEKPDLEKAQIELAQVLHWHGQGAAAAKLLKDVAKDSLGPQERLLLADIYMIQKEYAKAEPLYRDVLKENPQDHRTRLKLAEMLSWDKKYAASLTEYEKLLKALPEDIQIRRKYAMVLIWDGQHEKAVPELRRTLK
ncbi:MAG: tetratricopeptide repeat protein [Desulfobacteraceae bacterium]|nr:tetratricopeptide repeat protein [Desulfobacteraceae bacterium]